MPSISHDPPPETGGKIRVDEVGEGEPVRKVMAEIVAAHPGVLGGINRAARLAGYLVQAVQQIQRLLPQMRKIQRQRDACAGKGH